MSIRFKIALLFALLASLIVSVVGLSVYFFTAKQQADNFKLRLKNRAWSTATVAAGVKDSNYALISKYNTTSVATLYNKSVIVLNHHNQVVYSYSDVPGNELVLSKEIIENTKLEGDYFFKEKGRSVVAVQYSNEDNNLITAVAAEDQDGKEFLQELGRLLLWTLLVFAILSFVTGLFFARTLILPVRRISAEVNLISSNNLSQRLQPGSTKDELHKLSETFNNLLDRLQESFIIQRRFISNASHELSTPLTSVSSQLEVALQKERSSEEYKDVLKSVHEDVKDLQQLTKSLLDIAKTGTEGSIDLSDVRIDEVLLKVAADVQKLDTRYKVDINFETLPDEEEYLTVFGNYNLLYISFKNIVENGCKYSDDKHAVVNGIFTQSSIIIQVHNKGDVIAESDIQNIFQPFFRTDTAQSKQGFGLGLALTRRILSLHKATVEVSSDPIRGTIFTITLPNKAV